MLYYVSPASNGYSVIIKKSLCFFIFLEANKPVSAENVASANEEAPESKSEAPAQPDPPTEHGITENVQVRV